MPIRCRILIDKIAVPGAQFEQGVHITTIPVHITDDLFPFFYRSFVFMCGKTIIHRRDVTRVVKRGTGVDPLAALVIVDPDDSFIFPLYVLLFEPKHGTAKIV